MTDYTWLFYVMLGTILLLIAVIWGLIHVYRQGVARLKQEFGEQLDRHRLEEARLRKVAQDVYPYVAQSSVDLFYGEINGEQANFAQRQQISAKVQHQNQVVQTFEETFDIGHTAKMQNAMLSVSPDLSPLDVSGREALDLMSDFQHRQTREGRGKP